MLSIDSMPLRVMAVVIGLACVMAVTDLGGDALRRLFALETGAVTQGQIWRLATAHIVNLSRTHTYLNILGLGLIYITLWSILTPTLLIRAILGSAAAISLGWLICIAPGVTYTGFSGVTHGVLLFGGLTMLRVGPRWFGWLILTGVAAKLGHEWLIGSLPGADGAIGGRVSYISHTLGSLGGALAASRAPVRVRLLCIVICIALTVIQGLHEAPSRLLLTIAGLWP